jgi:hypothetical protein
VKVEFLYWDECPSHELALQRLREVLKARQIFAPIHVIAVTTAQQAAALRFPGSPTIMVNGHDLFPAPGGPYGLTCRLYHTEDGGVTPLPSRAMIERALGGQQPATA